MRNVNWLNELKQIIAGGGGDDGDDGDEHSLHNIEFSNICKTTVMKWERGIGWKIDWKKILAVEFQKW